MIYAWLSLPILPMVVTLVCLFGIVAGLLILLSFGRGAESPLQSYRGVVPPFAGTVAVIFAILLGFLANDIWDRNRRAAAAVQAEAESLQAVTALAATFGLSREPLASAVRTYAETVVAEEWPRMEQGEAAPAAELALDRLLKAIVRLDTAAVGNGNLTRLLLDEGLAVRNARNRRLALSRDESETLKWLLVLTLAVVSQIAVAMTHLERVRPQIAALTIWTSALIIVIGLLAVYDQPFTPPVAVSPDPIAQLAKLDAKNPPAEAQPQP